ncbi:MAG: hypothetical protein KDB79_05950 [Acidobacteria bacterium]|nr:hypothetical protein [Acidobacteriota bacterium]
MKKLQIVVISAVFIFAGCASDGGRSRSGSGDNRHADESSPASARSENGVEINGGTNESSGTETADAALQPKDVRGFFMKLPNEYFVIESCKDFKKTSLCETDKINYLKTYTTVEDAKNGYLETGGDGAQSAMKMAIFRRPDGTYIVGLNVFGEAMDSYKFLEFSGGKWQDISLEIVPQYSTTNIYELPRNGTTIPVFAKKIVEQGKDFEVSEKGEKLYDLKWSNGEFSIQE